jgi:hypothetical protein
MTNKPKPKTQEGAATGGPFLMQRMNMTTEKHQNDALSIALLCEEREPQPADAVLLLEQQVDLASRQSLMPYDDGRPLDSRG